MTKQRRRVNRGWRSSLVLAGHQPVPRSRRSWWQTLFLVSMTLWQSICYWTTQFSFGPKLDLDGQRAAPAGFWWLALALIIDWNCSKAKVPVYCHWVPTRRDTGRGPNHVLLHGTFRPELSNSVRFNENVYEQDMTKGWGIQPAICNVL